MSETPTAPPVIELGYVGGLADTPARAQRANREGLRLHRMGDFGASRARFEEALEIHPTYTLARFNLACALAKLGELDRARTEALTAARQDPPGVIPRIKTDPDLAPLRQGEGAEALSGDLQAIVSALLRAEQRGLPVFRPHEVPAAARVEEGGYSLGWGVLDGFDPIAFGASARAGVLLPEERRFIPITRPAPGATTGLIDLAGRRVVMAQVTSWEPGDCGFFLWIDRIYLFDLGSPLDEPYSERAPAALREDVLAERAELGLVADGALLRMFRPPPFAELPARIYSPSGRRIARAEERTTSGPVLEIGTWRSALRRPPSGMTVEHGALLIADRRVELGRGHRDAHRSIILPLSGGGVVLVGSEHDTASSTFDGDTDCTADARYVIDRVDLAAGEVTRLAEGTTVERELTGTTGSWLEFVEHEGWVYIQVEAALLRWRDGMAAPEPFLAGLTFSPPYLTRGDNCCG